MNALKGTFTLLREPYGEDVERTMTVSHRLMLIWTLLTRRHVIHW
jgi:hypothetical protein